MRQRLFYWVPMAIEVKVQIEGLKRLRKQVDRNPALGKAIADAWSTIYRAFTRQRFHKLSRGGGGEWPPLSAATLRARRKGSGQGNAAILRDTGAMLASLQPSLGSGGMLQSTPRPLGFTAFLGGSQSYANGPTLSEVAEYHHTGAGRLPVREILVMPGAETIRTMSRKAQEIAVKFFRNR